MRSIIFLFCAMLVLSDVSSQPIGGSIYLNISDSGDNVLFKNAKKGGVNKLQSVSGDFILKDLSPQNNQLYNFEYQTHPVKSLDINGDYHLQIINSKTDEIMNIYLYHVPGRNYYLDIPFHEGYYILTLVNNYQSPKEIAKLEERFTVKKVKDKTLGFDIAPSDWNQHRLSNKNMLIKVKPEDYLIQMESAVKEFSIVGNSRYINRSNYPQAELIVDQENALLTFYYLNPGGMGVSYYEMYGTLSHISDSTFSFKNDSTLFAWAEMREQLLEGHEPLTRLVGNGIFSCLKNDMFGASLIFEDTAQNVLDSVNIRNLNYTEIGGRWNFDISSITTSWDANIVTQGTRYLQFDHINKITDDALQMPLKSSFTYGINMVKSNNNRLVIINDNGALVLEDNIKLEKTMNENSR